MQTKLLFLGFRGVATNNKRQIVEAVYESRAMLADHKAPVPDKLPSMGLLYTTPHLVPQQELTHQSLIRAIFKGAQAVLWMRHQTCFGSKLRDSAPSKFLSNIDVFVLSQVPGAEQMGSNLGM